MPPVKKTKQAKREAAARARQGRRKSNEVAPTSTVEAPARIPATDEELMEAEYNIARADRRLKAAMGDVKVAQLAVDRMLRLVEARRVQYEAAIKVAERMEPVDSEDSDD